MFFCKCPKFPQLRSPNLGLAKKHLNKKYLNV